ncbi:MAG: ECF transporter S component [Bacilli bacterium]|jgi:uncharacterized membrane protein|nr:ECF transporter S component [Bacilli bacterium]
MKRKPNRDLVFKMCVSGVFAALDYIVTWLVQIPIPVSSGAGYINLSDVFVFVLAALVGPWTAGIVGGLAGFASDFMNPAYAFFAPFSLLIKFIEGVVAGYLFKLLRGQGEIKKVALTLKCLLAFILSGILMAALYMLPDYVFYLTSPSSLPGGTYMFIFFDLGFNLLQGVVNAVLGVLIFLGLVQVKGLTERHSASSAAYEEIKVSPLISQEQKEEKFPKKEEKENGQDLR